MIKNKNHFFISYHGNKRNEFNNIYDQIKDKLDNIEIIVEPYCGSSAFSYFLSVKHPKKFKYILNDNNHYLMQLYDTGSNKKLLNDLISKLNEFSKDLTVNKYNDIVKVDKFENWFYKHKIYNIRPGLYPINRTIKTDFEDLKEAPIMHFLNNERFELYNDDGINILEHYKNNKKALIFLDPPYLISCNSFYKDCNVNIYEYLYNNQINKMKAYVVLCLENNWIIKLLFKDFIKFEYDKQYELSKKNTSHLIITN